MIKVIDYDGDAPITGADTRLKNMALIGQENGVCGTIRKLSDTAYRILAGTVIFVKGFSVLISEDLDLNSTDGFKLLYCSIIEEGTRYTVSFQFVSSVTGLTDAVASVLIYDANGMRNVITSPNTLLAQFSNRVINVLNDAAVKKADNADKLIAMTADGLHKVPVSTIACKASARLGDYPMYERSIFTMPGGSSFVAQGIATDGAYAYITSSSGKMRKVDLATGLYAEHTLGDSVLFHANGCDYCHADGLTYVCANGGNDNNNKILAIDHTLSVVKTITLMDDAGNPVYPHGIACDNQTGHFFVSLSYAKNSGIYLVEYTNDGKYVRKIAFDEYYSTLTASAQQGFGYDGKYFYIPLYKVENVSGYNVIAIFDRNGNHVRTQPCMSGTEIEDICYDYTNDRLLVSYYGTTCTVSEFIKDSGWLDLTDFVETGASNITSSTAQIRIKDGILYARGKLVVKTSGDLFRISTRVSPQKQKPRMVCHVAADDTLSSAKPTFLQWSSYSAPYQLNYAVYCANNGSIWLDGCCIPMD